MDYLDVDISLDKIGARIGWTVTADGLPALRAAVARGDFGRARILAVTPRGVTAEGELRAA
ncbi:MAG: hypothetical protein ACHQ7M_07545 [Chloroflexota bacterium]